MLRPVGNLARGLSLCIALGVFGCNDKKAASIEEVEALKAEINSVRTDAQNAKLAAGTAVAAAEEANAAAKVARSVAEDADKTAKEAKAGSLARQCPLKATPPKGGAPVVEVAGGKITLNRRPLPPKATRKDIEQLLGPPDRLADGDIMVYDKLGIDVWTEKTGEVVDIVFMLAREDGFVGMPTKTFEGKLTLDKVDVTVETFVPGRELGDLGTLSTSKNVENCFSRFTVTLKK
jgi:hypothetical protein